MARPGGKCRKFDPTHKLTTSSCGPIEGPR